MLSLLSNPAACPLAVDGVPEVMCPRHSRSEDVVCIDDHQFCDGKRDCNDGSDEDGVMCLFYQNVSSSGTEYAPLHLLNESLLN